MVLNTIDYHSWDNQILHLASLIITLDTTNCHTQHITGPNNATKPPRYWWSYTTTWMTVGSDRHIWVQHILIPKLLTPKSIVSELVRSSKVRLMSSPHQMSGSHHLLISLGFFNLSAHYTPVYPVNHSFLNINLTISQMEHNHIPHHLIDET